MAGDSFEYLRRILDGQFFTLICCYIEMFEQTRTQRSKRPRNGPFLKKISMSYSIRSQKKHFVVLALAWGFIPEVRSICLHREWFHWGESNANFTFVKLES